MFALLLGALTWALAGQAEPSAGQATQSEPGRPAAVVTEEARGKTPAAPTTSSPDAASIEAGTWLVNLARHEGHIVGRTNPRQASLHVLSLLEAATTVSPQCAEAYYWIYDLEQRLGRDAAARTALAQYVHWVPTDDAARLRHLELEMADRQTAEARLEYVRARLLNEGLSRVFESELHRWLAGFHYERRENAEAARHIEHALKLNPMNVAARTLAYEMFGETEPALQRVEMALQLIAMNPTQANLIWDLAEFLAGLSLHTHAQQWYTRAIDVHQRSASRPVPAEFWQQLALSYAASGDHAKAAQAADQALKIDEAFHAARLLRADARLKLGQPEPAARDMNIVSKAYTARAKEITTQKIHQEAAEVAWFFCYHQPDKDKALAMAQIAMAAPAPGPLARLAHACALRLNGRTNEAMPILKALAPADQLAALELARAQIERGNKAEAMTTLHKAATLRYTGIAHNLIRDLLARYGEHAAMAPPHKKLIDALDAFPHDVFLFHEHPEDFLAFTLRFADTALPTAGPVNLVFRLQNVGKFPITLGEGFMCRPLIAVSARLGGAEGTPYDNYLQVLMNARLVLMPGEAFEKTVAIDVGPLRQRLIQTATQTLDLEVAAMFDPVYANGQLTAGMGTLTAASISATRHGLDTVPSAMAALSNRANSDDVTQRILAADQLGALLADAEHRARGSADGLPLDAARATLDTLLSDKDWRVRAQALVAVGWSKLDTRLTNAAAPIVRRDPHPVVKLMAVRLFARQHGEKFVQVLELLSKSDPNRFVRMMAESYLPQESRVQANRSVSQIDDPPH